MPSGLPASASSRASVVPAVGNATNLNAEPVVHAGKGKAPTKLLVKDLVVGTGPVVTATSTVTVMYVGVNYKNAKPFTVSTWTSKQPAQFALNRVVPGFADGLVGMKVGGRREIVIPPSLGYGSAHEGPIVANETLVFVVDLESVSSTSGQG